MKRRRFLAIAGAAAVAPIVKPDLVPAVLSPGEYFFPKKLLVPRYLEEDAIAILGEVHRDTTLYGTGALRATLEPALHEYLHVKYVSMTEMYKKAFDLEDTLHAAPFVSRGNFHDRPDDVCTCGCQADDLTS